MRQYEQIDALEGININKSNKSKEWIICHYWYFKNNGYKFEPHVCNKCQHLSMMADAFENIAIMNVKSVYYRCVLWNMTKNVANNWLNNSKLDDTVTLWIWYK